MNFVAAEECFQAPATRDDQTIDCQALKIDNIPSNMNKFSENAKE